MTGPRPLFFLALSLLAATALSGSGPVDPAPSPSLAGAHTAAFPEDPEADPGGLDEGQPWEAATALEKALFYLEQGSYDLAEKGFVELLETPRPLEEKKPLLLHLADVYTASGQVAKAVDVLENCLRTFPNMEEKPEVHFQLGQLYRDLGLSDDSIGMFYRVLNSIVVSGEANLKKYLNLARLAQFEIALSHYNEEAYDRAFLLFDRIDLLELDPADRETVSYYKSLSLLKSGQNKEALALLEEFVEAYPESEYRPEMLFLKAEVLYRMNRTESSAEALLQLLESAGTSSGEASGRWVFWRQQAGNRLANRFYNEGNYLIALRIYQGMVGLDESPAWQLPIVYQIGLCFEKLLMFDRAEESYTYIRDELAKLTGDQARESLSVMDGNVRWRLEVLGWREEMAAKLEQINVKESPTPDQGESDS